MKVLLTGASGQVGWELQRTAPAGVQLLVLDHHAFDITEAAVIDDFFEHERPQIVINAAAYTAVDRAEQESERAYAVNALGPGLLSAAAARSGARLLHLSTDFVFGVSHGRAFKPEDATQPQGIYAKSKREGEQAVLTASGNSLVLRTAWVYSTHGGNFVKTMLRLMRERDGLRVVADQIGTPTWAQGLAQACWRALDLGLNGLHHWTDAGVASWYDFAVAIGEEAVAIGLLDKLIPIIPIATADYPTPAQRPAFSVLDKQRTWAALGQVAPHWRTQLRAMLRELQGNPDA